MERDRGGSNGLNGPLCVMRLMEANTEPLVVRFLANENLYLLSERAPQCNFIVVVDLSIPVGCCLFPLVGSEVFGICPLRLFQTVHTTVISIDRPTDPRRVYLSVRQLVVGPTI